MVKVGFICEGDCEKFMLDSPAFQQILVDNNIQFVTAINAAGNGNLLPKYLENYRSLLKAQGAEKIFIIADLETDPCFTTAKSRIGALSGEIVVIARKQFEAWILADNNLMEFLTKEPGSSFEFPENEEVPFQTIRKIVLEKAGQGVGTTKTIFSKRAIHWGFSIENAAKHPNCPSANYFLNQLVALS